MKGEISDFLERAQEGFMQVAEVIGQASEPFTLEALCELQDIVESAREKFQAAINLTIDQEGVEGWEIFNPSDPIGVPRDPNT